MEDVDLRMSSIIARLHRRRPPAPIPRDTLQLGHAYRLIAVDEVTRAVQARKEEKTRRAQRQRLQAGGGAASPGDDQSLMDDGLDQLEQQDRDGHPSSSTKGSRHRQWRPSLHSIAEVSS
ncbi:uncharacterized protein [Triticum aestivum]|uniref:uncharacterized protein n=1 Tax=Triticum aestivum TaxID=4565 RepID=UPI001D0122C9|nr:uncharacterized protein LOC123090133 [Triticum aestivum]